MQHCSSNNGTLVLLFVGRASLMELWMEEIMEPPGPSVYTLQSQNYNSMWCTAGGRDPTWEFPNTMPLSSPKTLYSSVDAYVSPKARHPEIP